MTKKIIELPIRTLFNHIDLHASYYFFYIYTDKLHVYLLCTVFLLSLLLIYMVCFAFFIKFNGRKNEIKIFFCLFDLFEINLFLLHSLK